RVALLRSPILPTARRKIPPRNGAVQPRIIRGVSRSSGRNDRVLSPDISTVMKMRTFLLLPDKGSEFLSQFRASLIHCCDRNGYYLSDSQVPESHHALPIEDAVGVHPDRAAGRHRHHRRAHWSAVARCPEGPRSKCPLEMPEQSQTAWRRHSQLSRRP